MDLALLTAAVMLGLAGLPHCAAMCGAACTAALGRDATTPATLWSFHLARIAAYAAAGALAAASVDALAALGGWSPALRPLWTLLHAGALMLGLWLLWQGRQPGWLATLGRQRPDAAASAEGWQALSGPGVGRSGIAHTTKAPLRGAAAGALWVAWPCGLLQSALVVAALANTPLAGATVMAGFATVSAAGLGIGPWLWRGLNGRGTARNTARAGERGSLARAGPAASAQATAWAVRLAGLMLASASAWALGHGLWQPFLAWCAG